VSASLMGFDPMGIAYLAEAARFLGQGDRDRIEQRGEDPDPLTRSFAPPPTGEGVNAG
jgi:hypothetical protein